MAKPKRLMVGYLLGACMTSITLGLVIAFSLHGSSTESTSAVIGAGAIGIWLTARGLTALR